MNKPRFGGSINVHFPSKSSFVYSFQYTACNVHGNRKTCIENIVCEIIGYAHFTVDLWVASVVNFVPMIVGNSISVAAMAVLSQQLGAGEQGRAQAFARASLRWMFVAGAVVSVLSALPAAICVDSIGSEGSVRSDAIHYLVVSNLGCLPMFVLMQATAVMRAAGETAAPLFVLLFANGLNLVLDVVLLFGWEAAGIPAIGVTGAAYATVASRAVAAVVALWWLHRPQICL